MTLKSVSSQWAESLDVKPGNGIKVVGAGWGRTGTLSLKAALERLTGEKCHHMVEVFQGTERHQELWVSLQKGEPVDLDELFAGFGAFVDFPGCLVWREAAEHWPDSRVILSVREPEAWHRSCLETIYATYSLMFDSPLCGVVRRINAIFLPSMVRRFQWTNDAIWQGVFFKNGPLQSLEGPAGLALVKQRMEEWNAAVTQAIPPERLLVFKVSEGWAPLCKFLGVPIPDTPFPQVNDTPTFKKRIRVLKVIWFAPTVLTLAALAGAAFWGWKTWVR